jgi:hypothetical protein
MFVCIYSVCIGSDLATDWSPVQGVLATALGLRNWSETERCSKLGVTGKRDRCCWSILTSNVGLLLRYPRQLYTASAVWNYLLSQLLSSRIIRSSIRNVSVVLILRKICRYLYHKKAISCHTNPRYGYYWCTFRIFSYVHICTSRYNFFQGQEITLYQWIFAFGIYKFRNES